MKGGGAASDRRRRNSRLHVLRALACFGPRLPAWVAASCAVASLQLRIRSECFHTRAATVPDFCLLLPSLPSPSAHEVALSTCSRAAHRLQNTMATSSTYQTLRDRQVGKLWPRSPAHSCAVG